MSWRRGWRWRTSRLNRSRSAKRKRQAIDAAWRAFQRCYGVPYARELDPKEQYGMRLLEALGKIESDDGAFGDLHWHQRPGR